MALPSGLKFDDISWEPTWEEKALDWHRQQITLAHAEIKRLELLEQRTWLEAAQRRMVAVALEIDEYKRQDALQAEIDRTDAWWATTREREKAQSAALAADYQKVLDKGVYEQMVERAKKAQANINRDTVRIERLALLSRGAVRGRRA